MNEPLSRIMKLSGESEVRDPRVIAAKNFEIVMHSVYFQRETTDEGLEIRSTPRVRP